MGELNVFAARRFLDGHGQVLLPAVQHLRVGYDVIRDRLFEDDLHRVIQPNEVGPCGKQTRGN